MSLRELARRVGISDGHLSRALRHERRRRVGGALAQQIARELDLDPHYFREARFDYVIERLRENGVLLDEVYERVRSREQRK